MPVFSVLVPTYNGANFIERCIESVLNQTFKDFELIILDDGSNDNTKELLDKYINSYSNIKYYYQRNRGLAFCRNKLIDLSSSEYLVFLDNDDWLEKDTLESYFNIIKEKKSDLIFSKSYLATQKSKKIKLKPYRLLHHAKKDTKEYFLTYNSPFFWCCCIKKELFTKNNIRVYDEFRYFEDAGTMLLLISNSKNFFYLNKYTNYYFNNKLSLSRNNINYTKINDAIEQVKHLLQTINKELLNVYEYNQQIWFYIAIIYCHIKFQSRIKRKLKKELLNKLYEISILIPTKKLPKIWYKKWITIMYWLSIIFR